MQKPKVLTLSDYWGMIRRKWYWILFPAIAGVALGYTLTLILPKHYTSQALLLIEQQQVPGVFVQPIVTDDLNARIAKIEEQALSRTQLEPLIQRYHLFKDEGGSKSMDELVALLQKAVTLTPVASVVRAKDESIPGFYLAVELSDPRTAQEACADITAMFIDEDIRERQHSAEGTTSFLQTQVDDAKNKLDAQDAILAAFERKYMGMLPDEAKTNLGMLGTLNTQLQAATDNLSRAVQDKAYTESLLAQQVDELKLSQRLNGTTTGPDSPAVRLARLQDRLTSLQARYTDQYPDVVKTKAEIADVKKQIAADPLSKNVEPAEIQRLRAQLQSLTQTVKVDMREEEQLRADINKYKSRLQLSPAVEEQYKKITRDHDTAVKFYDDLLAKRDESEMATDLERRQQGEQLSVMDAADLPDQPSFPKPVEFLVGGLAAGLALGVAIVLGIGTTDTRIRTARDIEFFLGTVTFAIIPSIGTSTITKPGGRSGPGRLFSLTRRFKKGRMALSTS